MISINKYIYIYISPTFLFLISLRYLILDDQSRARSGPLRETRTVCDAHYRAIAHAHTRTTVHTR